MRPQHSNGLMNTVSRRSLPAEPHGSSTQGSPCIYLPARAATGSLPARLVISPSSTSIGGAEHSFGTIQATVLICAIRTAHSRQNRFQFREVTLRRAGGAVRTINRQTAQFQSRRRPSAVIRPPSIEPIGRDGRTDRSSDYPLGVRTTHQGPFDYLVISCHIPVATVRRPNFNDFVVTLTGAS
jgi:hypothetical protein